MNNREPKTICFFKKAAVAAAFFTYYGLCINHPSLYLSAEEIVPVDRLSQERERLKSIKAEISELTRQVKEFESREDSVIEKVEKYQLILNLRTAELRGIEQNLTTTELEIKNIEKDVSSIDKGIQQNLKYLKGRLRTMYKLGGYNYLRILLSLDSPDQIKKGIWYLSRLTRKDRKHLEKLERDYNKLNIKLKELKIKKNDTLALKDLSEKKRAQISTLLSQEQNLLDVIRNTKSLRLAAIDELRGASSELEKLIIKISEGAIDATAEIKLNIKNFKGLLNPPVEAKIKKEFGNEIHPIFGIKIPHNGLTFSAKSGTEVKAIFAGKVIYNKRFKGYGNLVIIDHSSGVISFYAHLLKSLVSNGEQVIRNQTIALSGESGSLEGEMLFFEIIEDGKPVNPVLWLKQKDN